jgi:hypothetical protein
MIRPDPTAQQQQPQVLIANNGSAWWQANQPVSQLCLAICVALPTGSSTLLPLNHCLSPDSGEGLRRHLERAPPQELGGQVVVISHTHPLATIAA